MKSFLQTSISLVLILLVISCSKDDPIQFSLSVQVSPSEAGNVSLSSGLFEEGEVVSISATPSTEYNFSHWEGDATGTNNHINITMTSDKAITAVFEKKQYPLTILIDGEGTVKEELLANKTDNDYPSGASVQLTAEPNEGWAFVEWSEDITGTENPKTILVDAPKTVKAKFEPILYKQILGKWDVRQAAKPSESGKGAEKECIVYSIVFNEDGSFVLTLDSGQISGTFYFDSSNSIVLNDNGKFDNLHIHNNVLNFHLNLNNLCDSDGTADEDDDYNEGECVSFLECNDGTVFVNEGENTYRFFRTTNHENDLWIEYFEFNTNLHCKTDAYDNLDDGYFITMKMNDADVLKYEIQHPQKGTGVITLSSSVQNSLLVTMDFNNDTFDEEQIFNIGTQELFNEYWTLESCKLTYVPDDNFEQALIDYGYDDVLDNYVLTGNIETITGVDLNNKGITSLTGIEDFQNLKILTIENNNINSIDVSAISTLEYLFANGNNISTIDLTMNLNLLHLVVGDNPISTIDVSKNTKLVRLEVFNTPMVEIDVSNNPLLLYLRMDYDKNDGGKQPLTSINLSNNPEITDLLLNNTEISSIDLSNNPKLVNLRLRNTYLTSLDVSNMSDLIELYTEGTGIDCIKVSEAQLNNIPSTWYKDELTSYAIDCNIDCQTAIPQEGLIAYYPFNGNANDSGPNGINGIVHGATLVSDRFGNPESAYSFENALATFGNSMDWIELPYFEKFNFNQFTISTWVYAREYFVSNTNNSIHYSALIARHDGGCDVGGAGLRFYIGPEGEFYSQVEGLSPKDAQEIGVVQLEKWIMLTMSFDGSILRQYVDGVLVNEVVSNGEIIPDSCNTFTFGEAYMANGHWYNFNGVLDDIGMWNRALSAQEVVNLYSCND